MKKLQTSLSIKSRKQLTSGFVLISCCLFCYAFEKGGGHRSDKRAQAFQEEVTTYICNCLSLSTLSGQQLAGNYVERPKQRCNDQQCPTNASWRSHNLAAALQNGVRSMIHALYPCLSVLFRQLLLTPTHFHEECGTFAPLHRK